MEARRMLPIMGLLILAGIGPPAASRGDLITEDRLIVEGDRYGGITLIQDSPPDQTAVTMTGGVVDSLMLRDSSTFTATGGHVSSIFAYDSTTVSLSGEVAAPWVNILHFATGNVSGGDIGSVHVVEFGVLNVSGGAGIQSAHLYGTSVLTMTGGDLDNLGARDESLVNLFGGTVEAIWADDFEGQINVYGSGLGKRILSDSDWFGEVYGVFANGMEFAVKLGEEAYPRVNLIPEPATLLLLGAGGLLLRRGKATQTTEGDARWSVKEISL